MLSKKVGNKKSTLYNLLLLELTLKMNPQSGKEGEIVSLTCICNDVQLEPKWYKGNVEIQPSEKYSFQVINGKFILVIKDVQPEDEGTYNIRVDHVEASASLTVKEKTPTEKPAIILQPKISNEGETTVFTCKTDITKDVPKWFKGDKEIFPCEKYNFSVEEGKYVLAIRDSGVEDDDLYKIKVNDQEASAQLTVKG